MHVFFSSIFTHVICFEWDFNDTVIPVVMVTIGLHNHLGILSWKMLMILHT